MNKEKIYVVGNERGTVKYFAAKAGVGIEAMRRRLTLCLEGKFPADLVLAGKNELVKIGGNAAWNCLSDQPRNARLNDLPHPTKFDEMFAAK